MQRTDFSETHLNVTDNTTPRLSFIDQTARIIAAYVGHNSVSAADLPKLISDAHSALTGLWQATPAARKPAVPIKNSITRNAVVCLEDGKPFHSLKRHLKSGHNLTPEQYRQKWNLPADYPMVAPAYSSRRSELAKRMGLGKSGTARRGRRAR
jgi:predicted transcriptional regulator